MVGGWVAAEMMLLHPSRVAGYVLIDAVGIEVCGGTRRPARPWSSGARLIGSATPTSAAAIPGAEFMLLPETGHLPQIETPDA